MYEELVKLLRNNAEHYMTVEGAAGLVHLLTDTADAIEELIPFKEQVEKRMGLLDKADELLKAVKPHWIPVTERLPEESEGLDWHEGLMIRFTSVWCYDVKTGTIEVRNRYQGKMTGNEYLDQYTEDTDWHWSKSWWEPTHWMPRVPLPEPPEGEEND